MGYETDCGAMSRVIIIIARAVGAVARHSSLERKAQSSMPFASTARAFTYLIDVKKCLEFVIIFIFVLCLKKIINNKKCNKKKKEETY